MEMQEALNEAVQDLFLYGIMVIKTDNNGKYERLDPKDVLIDFPETGDTDA